jgi:uncharacterized protein (TIGR00369 family)
MSEVIRAPKTMGHLEALQRMAATKEGKPPIARLIGFDLESIELGRSVFSFVAGEKHANPMGTLHGGVICDVADAAMGTAVATTLEDDESFTTLTLTADYFKPVWTQKLRAAARVTKRTRQIGFIECEVEDEQGRLVAKVQSTCLVLRGEEAKGR